MDNRQDLTEDAAEQRSSSQENPVPAVAGRRTQQVAHGMATLRQQLSRPPVRFVVSLVAMTFVLALLRRSRSR